MMFLSLWILFAATGIAAAPDYQHLVIAADPAHCEIHQDPQSPVELADLLENALGRGCASIRIDNGVWEDARPVLIERNSRSLKIGGEGSDGRLLIRNSSGPALIVRDATGIVLQDFAVEGGIELDRTEDVALKRVSFVGKGIHLPGRRCNQPSECKSFNRRLLVDSCRFTDCDRGILAERLENSAIRGNYFTGHASEDACSVPVGIELDGGSEDVDRRFEYGHSKANLIVDNLFDQEFSTGIRIAYSQGNTLRDNRFFHSFRAVELLQGANYNQIQSSYIGYLSQTPSTAACPSPCGVYLGPGVYGNVFTNNLFEQSLELQFLERHKNRIAVCNESGGRNVFHSDLSRGDERNR
jgi:parallel beta-helix repeat protein